MNKRENALARIKFCGYHQSTDWLKYYIENRISYQAAQEAYRAGYQAKIAGVKCNCQECATKTAPAWELLEQRADYYFWKYTDSEYKPVYNVTRTPEPPTTDGGYYSYGYLLKVKGLLAGPTVSSIIQDYAR